MLKYSEFILEYQTLMPTTIDLDSAVKYYNRHCSNWDLNKLQLYRGVTNTNNDYEIVDPSKYTRTVGKASEIYNSIIHILDSWKDYPNRYNSIIVSTSEDYAITYSNDIKHLYVVIPTNGSKIGVCNANDFWYTFEYMQKLTKLPIVELMKKLSTVLVGESIKSITEASLSINLSDLKQTYKSNTIIDLWKSKYSDSTLFEMLEDIFSPEKNNIILTDKQTDIADDKSDYELWIGGECLYVRYELFDEFKSNVK